MYNELKTLARNTLDTNTNKKDNKKLANQIYEILKKVKNVFDI